MVCVSYWEVRYYIIYFFKCKAYGGLTIALLRRCLYAEKHLHPLTGAAPRWHGCPGRHCLCWCCWPSTTAWWLSVNQLPGTPYMGLSVLTLYTVRHSTSNVRTWLDTGVCPAPHPSADLSSGPLPISSNTSHQPISVLAMKLSSLKKSHSHRSSIITKCLHFLQLAFMVDKNPEANGFPKATQLL